MTRQGYANLAKPERKAVVCRGVVDFCPDRVHSGQAGQAQMTRLTRAMLLRALLPGVVAVSWAEDIGSVLKLVCLGRSFKL